MNNTIEYSIIRIEVKRLRTYISQEATNVANDLLREMFKMNSICDNLVYNLENMGLHKCAEIFHENYAHRWPDIADELSGVMTKLNARAVRRGFDGDEETYQGISAVFNTAKVMTENIRNRVLQAMDALDYDINNKELNLKLEDVAVEILDMLYQANIWAQYAEYYEKKDKVMQFDQNFDKFKAPLIGGDSTEDD